MKCVDVARIGAKLLGIDLDLEALEKAIEIGKVASALTMIRVALDACRNGSVEEPPSSICFVIDTSLLNDVDPEVARAIESACSALTESDCRALKTLENMGFDIDASAEDYARRYGYASASYVKRKYVARTAEAYRRLAQALNDVKEYLLRILGEKGIERLKELGLLQPFLGDPARKDNATTIM